MISVNGCSFGRVGRRRRGTQAAPKTSASWLPSSDPITPRRFPPARALDLNRITNLSIELHALHSPALSLTDKGHLLPDFYSGATATAASVRDFAPALTDCLPHTRDSKETW